MSIPGNGRLPRSSADREYQSYTVDRDGVASRRVTDPQTDAVLDRLDSILEALEAIRFGIGALIDEEI